MIKYFRENFYAILNKKVPIHISLVYLTHLLKTHFGKLCYSGWQGKKYPCWQGRKLRLKIHGLLLGELNTWQVRH